MYNFTGFLFYSIYNIVAYRKQHSSDSDDSVKINDIAFAVHAFIATCVLVVQIIIYEVINSRFFVFFNNHFMGFWKNTILVLRFVVCFMGLERKTETIIIWILCNIIIY